MLCRATLFLSQKYTVTPVPTPLNRWNFFAEMTFRLIQDYQGPNQRHISVNNLPRNWGSLINEIWGYHPSAHTFICPIEIIPLLSSTRYHYYCSTDYLVGRVTVQCMATTRYNINNSLMTTTNMTIRMMTKTNTTMWATITTTASTWIIYSVATSATSATTTTDTTYATTTATTITIADNENNNPMISMVVTTKTTIQYRQTRTTTRNVMQQSTKDIFLPFSNLPRSKNPYSNRNVDDNNNDNVDSSTINKDCLLCYISRAKSVQPLFVPCTCWLLFYIQIK
jgi:hypothetical protein